MKLQTFACLGLLIAATSGAQAADSKTYQLKSQAKAGDTVHVEADFELGGQLSLAAGDQLRNLPTSVKAKLVYDERLLEATNDRRRSLREYATAEATVKIDSHQLQPTLREDRQLVGVDCRDQQRTLFSPVGPMTREELDLVDIVGNSLLTDMLLPAKAVKIDESWKHVDRVLASLLCLDAVKDTDVQSTLTTVEDDTAKITLLGHVQGAIGGVSTELQLKGRYNFDLKRGRITWFALAIREKRSVGHVGPGLEITGRLRMQMTPIASSSSLDAYLAAKLPLDVEAAGDLLSFRPISGNCEILHDRRWYITRDDRDVSVLRMVDRGDLVAQCNLSTLKPLPTQGEIDLGKFQADVQKSLGKNFQQFTNASQKKLDSGNTLLKVVAVGTVAELPIQWNFYQVVGPNGDRVSFSFTLEGELVERFAEADSLLVENVQFIAPKTETAGKSALTK